MRVSLRAPPRRTACLLLLLTENVPAFDITRLARLGFIALALTYTIRA